MKRSRKIFALTMVLMLMLSSIVSASSDVTNESIRVTEPFINGVPTVDPTPKLDKGMLDSLTTRSSSPRVTASDIGLYKTSSDFYYAQGYVTMKQDNSDFYHYTRAELDITSWMSIISSNIYGYGKVSAETRPNESSGTARIYYGW